MIPASGLRLTKTGTGPPILLINGLTRTQSAWANVRANLPGRTIVTFDAPGIGGTRPEPLSIAALANLSARVLDHFGIDRADILGFSHGGAVAQQLAHAHPERVDRLILAGTLPGVGSTVGNLVELLQMGDAETDAMAAGFRALALARWSSIGWLGSLTMPTLVVVGERDRIALVSNSRVLAGRIPGAVLRTLDAGHDLQDPASALLLARVVEQFLSSTNLEESA